MQKYLGVSLSVGVDGWEECGCAQVGDATAAV